MKKISFLLVMFAFVFNVSAAQFKEGKQYTTLKGTITNAPKVLEFFSFYCPACRHFEVTRETVSKNLPDQFKIVKYHTEFLSDGTIEPKLITKAWAVAMALGVENKVTMSLFKAFQGAGKTIKDESSLKKAFIEASGISSEKYDAAWNGIGVQTLVRQQQGAMDEFKKIFSDQGIFVPAIIIDGHYLVNTREISQDNFVQELSELVTFLLDKEKK